MEGAYAGQGHVRASEASAPPPPGSPATHQSPASLRAGPAAWADQGQGPG